MQKRLSKSKYPSAGVETRAPRGHKACQSITATPPARLSRFSGNGLNASYEAFKIYHSFLFYPEKRIAKLYVMRKANCALRCAISLDISYNIIKRNNHLKRRHMHVRYIG